MPLIDDDTPPQPKKEVPITQNHIDTFVRQTAQLDAQMLAIELAQRTLGDVKEQEDNRANNGEDDE